MYKIDFHAIRDIVIAAKVNYQFNTTCCKPGIRECPGVNRVPFNIINDRDPFRIVFRVINFLNTIIDSIWTNHARLRPVYDSVLGVI